MKMTVKEISNELGLEPSSIEWIIKSNLSKITREKTKSKAEFGRPVFLYNLDELMPYIKKYCKKKGIDLLEDECPNGISPYKCLECNHLDEYVDSDGKECYDCKLTSSPCFYCAEEL